MPSNHLILCPLLPCIQSFPTSGSFLMSWLFSNELPKYWSFSFSISPSNEYSGLISFRVDSFDLFAAQETLKSLLQHHRSKAINFSMHNLLYGPTLTSIHDYWKNHSFDYTVFCWQSNVSAIAGIVLLLLVKLCLESRI